ncbi:MAG: cation transporter [Sedimentisphaerales bacterium]|nr:cation transporter [Sedimentisphaerales bacterium]
MPNKEKHNSIYISLICNILLMAAKCITGILANSNALIADAIQSMTDAIAFFINYRACNDCQMYSRIDRKRTSKKISQKVTETETKATYYMGVFLFTIGLAICFHNFMILALDRVERPDFISVVVALIALAAYGGLYKYSESTNNDDIKECIRTRQNSHWQNKMNLVSGTVVVIGLIASMSGFIFMDELAAVVVGGILVAMGIKLFIETREDLGIETRRYFKPVIISSVLISIVLAAISLSIQL